MLSTNVDKKYLETNVSIDICRQTDDEWQSKTLCRALFDPRSSIVKGVFDRRRCGTVSLVNEDGPFCKEYFIRNG